MAAGDSFKPERIGFVLSSKGSLSSFPENTNTDFRNKIATPVKDAYDCVYLRVEGVSLACDIEREINHPFFSRMYKGTHAHVCVANLMSQRYGDGWKSVAATFKYPPDEKGVSGNYCTHTFQNPIVLPMRVGVVPSIRVTIEDGEGNQLPLLRYLPTYVWGTMMNFPKDASAFTVTCSSAQPSKYPDNTLCKFYTPLFSGMNLEGYEVALQSVSFPLQMEEAERDAEGLVVNGVVVPIVRSYRREVVRRARPFQHLADDIDACLVKALGEKTLRFNLNKENSNRPTQGVFYVPDGADGPAFITMNDSFIRSSTSLTPMDYSRLNSSSGHVVYPGEAKYLPGQVDPWMNNRTPVAVLLSDIMENSSVGGREMPMLSMLPTPITMQGEARPRHDTKTFNSFYEPRELVFRSIVQRTVNRIGFQLATMEGELREFYSVTEEPIVCTLVFRAKK